MIQTFSRGLKALRYLHISRNIERCLEKLRMRGRQGDLAASQYLQIMECMRRAEWCSDVITCKKTKNGEYRLKNCIKYDLGHGYRLVTVKNGPHLFITFVGSHDQTDRWIETHRYASFCADHSIYVSEIIDTEETDTGNQQSDPFSLKTPLESDEYEQQLEDKIDETVLKAVFQGLFGKPVQDPLESNGKDPS